MITASTRRRRATYSASRRESACRVSKQPSPAASMRERSGGGRTVHTVTMATMVLDTLQLLVIGTALREAGPQMNFRTQPMQKYALLTLCALALGCDALPKFQLQLQSEIQREFHITNAMIMVVDTTYMLVAIFDDAHAAAEGKERAA